MKSFWNIISFVAVVNLLVLLLFGGWLWKSDRLNVERARQIKDLLALTLQEEELVAAEAALEAEREQEEQAMLARLQNPPLPSEEQVAGDMLVTDKTTVAMLR